MLKLIILGNFISGLICGIILMIVIARKEKKILIEDLLFYSFLFNVWLSCIYSWYTLVVKFCVELLLKKVDKIKDNVIIDFSEK